MTVPPFFEKSNADVVAWEQMGFGAPMIMALAQLCGRALVLERQDAEGLSVEAKAILYAARHRGVIEVKGSKDAFEAPERFLTVYVELDQERRLRFRTADPRVNVRFFDGFRELCARGLVMHQLLHEFSLTRFGFEVAERIDEAEVRQILELAVECGLSG